MTISWSAFADNKTIQSVIIPDSVEHFGEGVFDECSKSIQITYKGKTYKGADAFENAIE